MSKRIGSKIQASLGQPVERVYAVYTDGRLVGQYMTRVSALALARRERETIGETVQSRGEKASRVRVYPM